MIYNKIIKNIFKYFSIVLITLFTLPILIDYLGLYKLAVFTNKIFTSESKKSNKVRSYHDIIFNKKKMINYYGMQADPYGNFATNIHPYYQFSIEWKNFEKLNNKVVNIEKDGFRVSEYNNAEYEGFILGGSTAFGYFNQSDKSTISSILNKNQNDFNFKNKALPSWNSHQELLAFIKSYGPKTKISISLTLGNDITIFLKNKCNKLDYLNTYPDTPEYFDVLEKVFSEKDKKVSFLDFFPKTVTLVRRLQVIFTKEKTNFERSINIQYLDCKFNNEDVNNLSSVIIKNHKTIRNLIEVNGGRHILISQPIYDLHETAKTSSKYWSENSLRFRESVIREVLQSNFCKKDCIDFTKIFDENSEVKNLLDLKTSENISNAQMIDTLHTTSAGNEIIVKQILRYIKNEKKN